MSDSGHTNDYYRNDLARCARDWAHTTNWDVPQPLRERLLQIAAKLDELGYAAVATKCVEQARKVKVGVRAGKSGMRCSLL